MPKAGSSLVAVACVWFIIASADAGLSARWSNQQGAAPGARLIVGQVIDGKTGRPVGSAEVTVRAPAQAPSRVQTTSDGRFVFRDVSAEQVYLEASADGYLEGGYGQAQPGAMLRQYRVRRAGELEDLTLRVWPEAVIAGIVSDELGEALGGSAVELIKRQQTPGAMLQFFRQEPRYTATTNDLGEYRFGQLPPGTYLVSVPGRAPILPVRTTTASLLSMSGKVIGGETSIIGYPTAFAPGTRDPQSATLIDVNSGDHVTVDVHVTPVAVVAVSGRVVGPSGPAPNVTLCLFPPYALGTDLEFTHAASKATSRADGSFVFQSVPSGEYVLRAWSVPISLSIGSDALPAEPSLWAEGPVSVSGVAIRDLDISLQRGATLRGRVKFDGESPPSLLDIARMSLQPSLGRAFRPAWPMAMDRLPGVRVSPDGEFETQGLLPGRIAVSFPERLPAVPGWYLHSVSINGRPLGPKALVVEGEDISGIDLTFANRPTGLRGTVLGRDGQPDPSASIVLFPADFATWIAEGTIQRVARVVTTSDGGEFVMQGLMAGEYLAAALATADLARASMVEAIELANPSSVRVVIQSGTVGSLQLRIR